MKSSVDLSRAVAIIGIAGRFPGAKNVGEFWENLCNGKESISFFTDEEVLDAGVDPNLLKHPDYVKAWGYLEDADKFDANYFGIPAREAEAMDPQHRIFLEICLTALENSGYNPETYDGHIGLVCGVGISTYLLRNLVPNAARLQALGEYITFTGNDKDFMGTRVSYKLNLRGPAFSVSTACSTSLVASHLAYRQLLSYQADICLVGASNIKFPQKSGYLYRKGQLKSPDGRCHAFDAKARGTVFGSGVAAVVLKRAEEAIEDGDHIYGIIHASALNNDGNSKAGYTAPSVSGQAEVIAEAHELSGFPPETITHMEAHGTGTEMGDPCEVHAVSRTLGRTGKKQFCALTSVKTNVGHLDCSGGITGLIKVALSLKNKLIPPSLNFETPNPEIDFANSPFYVNTKLQEWNPEGGIPRRACISAFGAGGTNAHMVLQEAEELSPSSAGRTDQLLVFSAKTVTALEMMTDNLVAHLKNSPEQKLEDIVFTMNVGRRVLTHRRMIVSQTKDDLIRCLTERTPNRVFTHQAGADDDVLTKKMDMVLERIKDQMEGPTLSDDLLFLGKSWLEGGRLNWTKFYSTEFRHRLPLPTYPFESRSYWIEQPKGLAAASEESIEKVLHPELYGKKDISDWFYAPTWQLSVASRKEIPELDKSRCWLIFCNPDGLGVQLADKLRAHGQEVLTLYQGDSFSHPDSHTFVIVDNDPIHYNAVLTELTNLKKEIQGVVHFWDGSAEKPSLQRAMNQGFTSLICLAQAIHAQDYGHNVSLTVVTSNLYDINVHDVIYPEKATIIGPVRVISQEYPKVISRVVDVCYKEIETDGKDGVVAQLFGQCLDPSAQRTLAIRGDRLWHQAFQLIHKEANEPKWLNKNGVYLITGGLGGLGFSFAEYLAEQAPVKLILLGRSAIPPRSDWESLVANGDPMGAKIKKIMSLEEKGAQVCALGINVADREALSAAISQAEQDFGKISGVIHAAGVAGVCTIQKATPEQMSKFLVPKLEGTLNLAHIFSGHDLNFFVLCSSLASVMGGYGQVAYVAANAFLDAFAQTADPKHNVTAINWDAWQEVGMAASRQTESLQMTGISTAEGKEVLNRIIHSRMSQVMVSTTPLEARVRGSYHLDIGITDHKLEDSNRAYPRPDLSTAYVEPTNELEHFMASTWAHILGISSVGIHDDFFELGGDSIKGMNLVNSMEKRLGMEFNIETLFEMGTTAQLATYLHENHPKEVAKMLGHSFVDVASERFDATTFADFKNSFRRLGPGSSNVGPKNNRMVFILNPPCSGSTLLRVMLAGNPNLFSPPELHLLNYNTMNERRDDLGAYDEQRLEGLVHALMHVKFTSFPHIMSIITEWCATNTPCKQVYQYLQEMVGAAMVVDKTPSYAFDLNTLKRAEADFREPLFIHLTRHPYGMIRSYEKSQRNLKLMRLPFNELPNLLILGEMVWQLAHQNIISFFEDIPAERRIRIRFEDLVTNPQPVMERVSSFLSVPFDKEMLEPYKEKSKRMTDAIYADAKPLGDVNFLKFDSIKPEVADRWKSFHQVDFLDDSTWKIAESFGYERTGDNLGTGKSPTSDQIQKTDRNDEGTVQDKVDSMDAGSVDDMLSELLNS